jgi:hypothetical protein
MEVQESPYKSENPHQNSRVCLFNVKRFVLLWPVNRKESVLGGAVAQKSAFVQPTHHLTPHLFQKIAKNLYVSKT